MVARNSEPFGTHNKAFLTSLQNYLQAVSGGNLAQISNPRILVDRLERVSNVDDELLWPRLVTYYTARFDRSYFPSFNKYLEAYGPALQCPPTFTWAQAQARFTKGAAPKDFTDYSDFHWKVRCGLLFSAIYPLGCPRAAYETFIEAARRLPGFGNLTIHLLDLERLTPYGERPFLTFERALRCAKVTPRKTDIEKYFGPMDILEGRTESQYWIYAEVQILLHLLQQEKANGTKANWEAFEYINSSKLRYLSCSEFIRAYGQFTSQDSHGKNHSLWMIPETSSLREATVAHLLNSLQIVEGKFQRTHQQLFEGFRRERSESCPGVSATSAG